MSNYRFGIVAVITGNNGVVADVHTRHDASGCSISSQVYLLNKIAAGRINIQRILFVLASLRFTNFKIALRVFFHEIVMGLTLQLSAGPVF